MALRWLLRPGGLILAPLALLLLMAVACGTEDPTPLPTPTPVDVADIVAQALAGQAAGVTPADVAKAVQDALSARPGVTQQEVVAAIGQALASNPDITADQVASEIAHALSAQPGITSEDMAMAIEEALAAKPGLTEEQVSAAITKALQDQPGTSAEDIEKAVAAAVVKALPAASPSLLFEREGKRGMVVPMHAPRNPTGFHIWECGSTSGCLSSNSVLYNGIVELNPETMDEFDIRGDLARGWEVSDDGLTWTFFLFAANWSDGKPVTAEDVVFSLDSIVEPGARRPRAGQLRSYYEKGNARVIDDQTVEVTTRIPAAGFLPFLGLDYEKIYPKHYLETGVELAEDNQVTSGPFKFKSSIKDVSLHYERNDGYFKEGRPYFDGMDWFIISDRGTIAAAFKTEQIILCSGVCNLRKAQAKELVDDMGEKMSYWENSGGSPSGLMFNTKRAPFSDERVRKAINLALYRQEFNKILNEPIIGSPFLTGSWFYLSQEEQSKIPGYRELNGEKHPDDLAEAKKLMADAGFPDGFESEIIGETISNFVDMAQVFSDQLKRYLNIDAPVKQQDTATARSRLDSGDWQLSAFATGILSIDPDAYLQSLYLVGGERNYSDWEDPQVVALSNQIAGELDRSKRRALTLEAGKLLEDGRSGWSIMNYRTGADWVNNKIKNYHPVGNSGAYLKFEHTWFEDNYTIIGDRP